MGLVKVETEIGEVIRDPNTLKERVEVAFVDLIVDLAGPSSDGWGEVKMVEGVRSDGKRHAMAMVVDAETTLGKKKNIG